MHEQQSHVHSGLRTTKSDVTGDPGHGPSYRQYSLCLWLTFGEVDDYNENEPTRNTEAPLVAWLTQSSGCRIVNMRPGEPANDVRPSNKQTHNQSNPIESIQTNQAISNPIHQSILNTIQQSTSRPADQPTKTQQHGTAACPLQAFNDPRSSAFGTSSHCPWQGLSLLAEPPLLPP